MVVLQKLNCPRCDGTITFDGGSEKLKCPYCDTEFDAESIKSFLEDTYSPQQDDMTWERFGGRKWQTQELAELYTYHCHHCGGKIVCNENTAATCCPFCNKPLEKTCQLAGNLRPDLVIPFKLDKKTAKEALKKYFIGKKLLPKIFIDENRLDEIKGVYVPFWLFRADAQGNMTYKATRVRNRSDGKRDYTETMYYHVVRAGTLDFQNVSVVGPSKLDDHLLASLEPFDMQEAVDFKKDYLAGYFVDQDDMPSDECVNGANTRIKTTIEEAFRNTVSGYTSVNQQSAAVQLQKGSAQYVLCPVWLLTTTWKGQKYTFAMNGQTGKMVGDLPVDQKAFWRWFFCVFGIVTAACFIITWLLWMI